MFTSGPTRRAVLSRLNGSWKASRHIVSPNVSRSIASVGLLPQTNVHNQIQQQQVRRFGMIDDISLKVKAEQMKRLMDQNPGNSDAVLKYLKTLVAASPKDAAVYIEKGWNSGKIPVDEAYMREYFKAVGALKKFDSVNLTNLLGILRKQQEGAALPGGAAAGGGGSGDMAQLIAALNRSGSMSGGSVGGMGGSGAGSNPTDPLYITQLEGSWKSELWKLLKTAVGFFILLSFVSSMMDDKSPGGGIGGRLGLNSSAVHQVEKPDKTFDDVVGVDEAKGELQEIVQYLKDPKRFTRLGGKLPKGVLLTGAPGNGKTLLARAIAGEAGVPFFFASGSEFEEMFVGVGAKRVRELFQAAQGKSPCIIFIDEIDAIGGKRQMKDQSAMKMTLNELLVQMDGFQQNNGVIVIAATNFPDSLDSALVRPGRFDKHVDVPLPDIGGRKAILELYGKKVPLDDDVSMDQLARGTPGFSGAELFNLVNQAALKASLDGLSSVSMGALEYAKDKLMMGAERKSAIISPATMKCTAYHEAGHALVALHTSGANPIHKATIMPRGRALGMVMQLPEGDQLSMSREQMIAYMDVCMGGRVAEELIFGEKNVTSGASNDIMQATKMATAMVTQYGFSSKVGIVFIDQKNGKNGGDVAKNVDDEIRELLQASYDRVKVMLHDRSHELEIVAKALLEYESVSGREIADLIKGKQISAEKRTHRPSRDAPIPTDTTSSAASKNRGGGGGGGNDKQKKGVTAPTALSVAQPSTNSVVPAAAHSSSGGLVAPSSSSARNAAAAAANSAPRLAKPPVATSPSPTLSNNATTNADTSRPVPQSFLARLWGDKPVGATEAPSGSSTTRSTSAATNGASTAQNQSATKSTSSAPTRRNNSNYATATVDGGDTTAAASSSSSSASSASESLSSSAPATSTRRRGPPRD